MAGGEDSQRQIPRDYITLGPNIETLSIAVPSMVANNFELKPAFIFMMQQSQFGGKTYGRFQFIPLGFS